jgi:membrane protease YdiL (CAAX protease family)
LPHFGEAYSTVYLLFVFITFLLGLAFGAIMQRTNSLLGSVLFHAGTDIPVILGIFSNF